MSDFYLLYRESALSTRIMYLEELVHLIGNEVFYKTVSGVHSGHVFCQRTEFLVEGEGAKSGLRFYMGDIYVDREIGWDISNGVIVFDKTVSIPFTPMPKPGEKFALYEGRNLVARGEILGGRE